RLGCCQWLGTDATERDRTSWENRARAGASGPRSTGWMGVSSGQRVVRRRNTSARVLRSLFETRLDGFAISTYVDRGWPAAVEPAASPTGTDAAVPASTLARSA